MPSIISSYRSLSLLLLMAALMCAHNANAQETAVARKSRGLILETHVHERNRDADYLLAPLLDELRSLGFRSQSVTGTRIHSLHSLSSNQLSEKQVNEARRTIKDAHAAYLDFRFEGAIDSAARGLDLLMGNPATMARQQMVRELMYEALITQSMAHSRLGNKEGLSMCMGEFIRSFPDREVSKQKYGPEGVELHRRVSRELARARKGQLQIAVGGGSLVFVNERYIGIGSQQLELLPGRYRVFTQKGEEAGRVHMVEVEEAQQTSLVVDPVTDRSLRTSESFTGLVFASEAERIEHERRVALSLGKAIGAEHIILVGIHRVKGQDSIVASSLLVESGESGPSARIPLPSNGAPAIDQLRALAKFVAGSGPAGPEIEVLRVQIVSDRSRARDRYPRKRGISVAWRWAAWGVGALALGTGAYLVSIDGEGNCNLVPGQISCPETYETLVPGVVTLGAGTALGVTGFYLWTKEDGSSARISVRPSGAGFRATLVGTF